MQIRTFTKDNAIILFKNIYSLEDKSTINSYFGEL